MLSLEKCNKVLNRKENNYTMEDVKLIRESLSQFAEIIYTFQKSENEKFSR